MSKDFLTNIFKLVSLITIGCFVPGTNSLAGPAEIYTVTLDDATNGGSGGNGTIYEKFGEEWQDSNNNTITSVTIPTKTLSGEYWVFTGYYLDDKPWIDGKGVLPDTKTFKNHTTLTAQFEECNCSGAMVHVVDCLVSGVAGNQCSFTYRCDGDALDVTRTATGDIGSANAIMACPTITLSFNGSTDPNNTATTEIYSLYGDKTHFWFDSARTTLIDNNNQITAPTFTGWNFGGYFRTPDSHDSDDWYFNAYTNRLMYPQAYTAASSYQTDTTWYAQWYKSCVPGQYIQNSNSTCQTCPVGYYCPGGAVYYDSSNPNSDFGKISCEQGFTSDAGNGVMTGCYADKGALYTQCANVNPANQPGAIYTYATSGDVLCKNYYGDDGYCVPEVGSCDITGRSCQSGYTAGALSMSSSVVRYGDVTTTESAEGRAVSFTGSVYPDGTNRNGLANGEFEIVFGSSKVKIRGRALCSSDSGTNYVGQNSDPSNNSGQNTGQNCWCKAVEGLKAGEPEIWEWFASSKWVFLNIGTSVQRSCESECAKECVVAIKNTKAGDFRTPLLGGIGTYGCTPNQYTVTLDKNNVNATDGTTSVTAEYDSFLPAITLPTLSVPGVMFDGYYDTSAQTGGTQYYDENGTPSKVWDKTENSTLYARWVDCKAGAFCPGDGKVYSCKDLTIVYTHSDAGSDAATDCYAIVTWYQDKGDPSISPIVEKYYYDGTNANNYTISSLQSATKTGYTLENWYKDSSFNSQITAGYVADGDKDFYARWKKDVTFDYNNGDADGNGMCYFDDKLTLPATPTRQGYEFRGWILQQ